MQASSVLFQFRNQLHWVEQAISEFSIVLLITHIVLLLDRLHHVVDLVYVFWVQIEGCAEVLERWLHLAEFLVDLAYIYVNWCFLR